MNHQVFEAEALADLDIRTVDKTDLVDVRGVVFDPSVPQGLRAACVWKATGNPYCFRVGDLGVKLEFTENAPTLQKTMSDFLQRRNCGL